VWHQVYNTKGSKSGVRQPYTSSTTNAETYFGDIEVGLVLSSCPIGSNEVAVAFEVVGQFDLLWYARHARLLTHVVDIQHCQFRIYTPRVDLLHLCVEELLIIRDDVPNYGLIVGNEVHRGVSFGLHVCCKLRFYGSRSGRTRGRKRRDVLYGRVACAAWKAVRNCPW
jgi:hypothetical protein